MATSTKDTYVERFESWTEFVTKAETGKSHLSKEKRESQKLSNDFAGVSSVEEAVTLARQGWTKGAEDIKALASKLFNHVSGMIERTEVNHDVEGHVIDVARFVDGEPECWMKFDEVRVDAEGGHRLIRLVMNIGASGMVARETITRKGATVAALVELLEYAGHRVELTVVEGIEGYGGGDKPDYEVSIRLKEFDQALDLPVVAFALAHPATLRCLLFSVEEQLPEKMQKLIGAESGMGYGRPADVQTVERGDIYIPKMLWGEKQWDTPEAAQAWIIKNLEEQGIALKKVEKGGI